MARFYRRRHRASSARHPAIVSALYQAPSEARHWSERRFALADPEVSIDVISRDRARVAGGPIITPSLAVTCLDQLDGPILCADGSTLEPDDFIEAIAGPVGARRVLLSHGPTAATARFAARRPAYRLLRASAAPSASARSLA
jgi:hypothetical protein